MSDFKFEDPPPRGKHAAAAAVMRKKPGKWIVVSVHKNTSAASAAAHLIRIGYLTSYRPRDSFEAVLRTVKGEHKVYARYVGEEKK